MPQIESNGLTYEILHTGGFVKLYTLKGRLYWTTQANHGMKKPDWKIHFAISRQHIPLAWDIIAKLFMESKCEFGMKVRWQSLIPPEQEKQQQHQQQQPAQGEDAEAEEDAGSPPSEETQAEGESPRYAWSEEMWGREVTVYCYTNQAEYKDDSVPLDGGATLDLKKTDQKPRTFWKEFVRRAEKRLARNGVQEIRLNPGDVPFGKRYASLRNEAFVPVDPSWREWMHINRGETEIYPPNVVGYNGASHPDWLSSKKKKKKTMKAQAAQHQQTKQQPIVD